MAEVTMANFIAQHNLPFATVNHLTDVLLHMFPDSKIDMDYACKRMKTTAMVCDALKPYLRIFEEDTAQVVTCHLETVGITDLTAQGIFTTISQMLDRQG